MTRSFSRLLTCAFSYAITFLFMSATARAQTFQWTKGFGGYGYDEAVDVAVDAIGNTYTVGRVEDTADLDPGIGVHQVVPVGDFDAYIVKLDPLGNFVWAKSFGSVGNDVLFRIVINSSGDLVILGYTAAFMDVALSSSVITVSGFFILKLDQNGDPIWVHSANSALQSIATDENGNIYGTGLFGGTIDADPGAGVHNIISEGPQDVIIVKLDTNGDLIWAKSMGSVTGPFAEGSSITLGTNNNVYVTGRFQGTVDFDPAAGTTYLTADGTSPDIFVAKYDSVGNFAWARSLSGPQVEHVRDIAVDPQSNVYVAGVFQSTVDFDPGPGVYSSTAFGGSRDMFLLKLNSAANFEWAVTTGDFHDDESQALEMDDTGNVYWIGDFVGTADFDPGTSQMSLTTPGMDRHVFVAKYAPAGNPVWATSVNGNSVNDVAGAAIDGFGSIYLAGRFYADTLYAGNTSAVNHGFSPDGFMVKLAQCASTPAQPSAVAGNINPCESSVQTYYVSPATGAFYWTLPNGWTGISYSDSIVTVVGANSGTINVSAMNGCGLSTGQTLSVTVSPAPLPVIVQAGTTISTAVSYTAYQWLLNGGAITGETNSSYMPVQNGDYSVAVVDNNGCEGLSNSLNVIINDINDVATSNELIVFPNPGQKHISVRSLVSIKNIAVMDITGKVIYTQTIDSKNVVLDLPKPGVYFIKATTSSTIITRKILIN